jgi:hypothetical protein
MSVSPTDEALIVALDFEGEFIVPYHAPLNTIRVSYETGVHSLERSAQEDTLLVLFNTAISNLVRKPPDFVAVDILDTAYRSYSVITSP